MEQGEHSAVGGASLLFRQITGIGSSATENPRISSTSTPLAWKTSTHLSCIARRQLFNSLVPAFLAASATERPASLRTQADEFRLDSRADHCVASPFRWVGWASY